VNLVDQCACRCLGENSGYTAHGERDSYLFFIPSIASKKDGEEWPDSRLNVREKEVQPIKAAPATSGSRLSTFRLDRHAHKNMTIGNWSRNKRLHAELGVCLHENQTRKPQFAARMRIARYGPRTAN